MGTATRRRPAADTSAIRAAVAASSPAHASKRTNTVQRAKKTDRAISAALPPRRSPRRAAVVKQVQFGGHGSFSCSFLLCEIIF